MSDLISRKSMLHHFNNWQMELSKVGNEREYNLLEKIIHLVENEPSAFDLESVIEKFRKNEELMFSMLEKELDRELIFTVQKLFRTYTNSQIEILKSAANAANGKNGG